MGNHNDQTYPTAQKALEALNYGREGKYEYDKVQKWNTTPEQDRKAQDANKAHIDANCVGKVTSNHKLSMSYNNETKTVFDFSNEIIMGFSEDK